MTSSTQRLAVFTWVWRSRGLSVLALLSLFQGLVAAEPVAVGAARVDITPGYPVRLTGYAARKTESEGVFQKLWAKAVAIGVGKEASVLVTVDNCGVCANVTEEVARRLREKAGLPRERFVVCSSHTHSAPCIVGFAPNIFAQPIPPEQLATIDRYTRELTDGMERAALAALAARKPSRLTWGEGSVGFAGNRRTPGGPVDHSLPVLVARDLEGKVRVVLANYACHCTTLGSDMNKTCGDWAGFAQEEIEKQTPDAIALISIGCGADSNPAPRGGADAGVGWAKKHAQALAAQVARLLEMKGVELESAPECVFKRIELPYKSHFTRQEWEARSKQTGIVGYHAQQYLGRLDKGEALPLTLPYAVQQWSFGSRLAMVFLAGEVVVDYARRLKQELDGERIWVTAYANDVPCYIPSRRILSEGGYEAMDSLWYYGRPAQLAPEVEDLIVDTVKGMVPKEFHADPKKAEFPEPKSPEASLEAMRPRAGWTVQLAAAEPLIASPVAIDWSADGRLWVVEMRDFPTGMDGKWKPGGRVRVLQDADGDGKYEGGVTFLEDIPFPTGVTCWRKGVLVCAAPDILYAEDTDGDGRADKVEKLFSGFATDNYQARVNSLTLGLDGWIHGANGLIGGSILSARKRGERVPIHGRDFRFRMDGSFEPVSGLTQQGLVRDDFGNWFGCDNSTLLKFYPLPDAAIRRNPLVTYPPVSQSIAQGADVNKLHPSSRMLTRFNDPSHASRATSVCGLGMYRDDLAGSDYYGNAFLCEPVHNLVRRLHVAADGTTFRATQAEDEMRSEFLTSRDNWFRPVQVRTGPDGALWVVDMYRFVVEHPRWITAERLAQLDVRAGDDKGRLYRLIPRGVSPRGVVNLEKLGNEALSAALDTPNGTERDRVHIELLSRSRVATEPIEKLVGSSRHPAVRAQALSVLADFGKLRAALVVQAATDPDPRVRASVAAAGERWLIEHRPASGRDVELVAAAVAGLARDGNAPVRLASAFALGESAGPAKLDALAFLSLGDSEDALMRSGILSSVGGLAPDLIARLMSRTNVDLRLVQGLLKTAVGASGPEGAQRLFVSLTVPEAEALTPRQSAIWLSVLEALKERGASLQELETFGPANGDPTAVKKRVMELTRFLGDLRRRVESAAIERMGMVTAEEIRLLGWSPATRPSDVDLLVRLISSLDSAGQGVSSVAMGACFEVLERLQPPRLVESLEALWPGLTPGVRSRAVDLAVRRPEWSAQLMAALKAGTIQRAEISALNRRALLTHPNASTREVALSLFGSATPSSRSDLMALYESCLQLQGDGTLGAAVFGKVCASCHKFRGQGNEVGPDLAQLTDRSKRFLLVSILDPNAAIDTRFVNYSVDTLDGRTLSGVLSEETGAGVTLVSANNERVFVPKKQIKHLEPSRISLMPEGLEQGLDSKAMADLLEYLRTEPEQFGVPAVAKSQAALEQYLAGGYLGMASVLRGAELLPYPSWLGRLPLHFCRQTDGQSVVSWKTPNVRPSDLNHGVYRFRQASAMGFRSQPSGSFELFVNSRHGVTFDVSLDDRSWVSREGSVRVRYTIMQRNEEDSNGLLEIELDPTWVSVGQPVLFEVRASAASSQRWFGVYSVATLP